MKKIHRKSHPKRISTIKVYTPKTTQKTNQNPTQIPEPNSESNSETTLLPSEPSSPKPTSDLMLDLPIFKGESSVRVDDDDVGSSFDGVISRLEEMGIGGSDVELTEEQIRSNVQLQDDELLVLEAIYGENIVTPDRKGDLRSLQMNIHYDDPEGLTVSSNLESTTVKLKTGEKGQEGMKASDDSSKFLYSFKVRHLPPIVLTCLLTQSYPSHRSPPFTVYVPWLHSEKISLLCDMLDTIWFEQPGQEVLYRWVEWLQTSALSYLGFSDAVVLGPYGTSKIDDRRAISGIVAPEADITSIISYNDKRCHESFLSTIQQCVICFSDYPGTNFIQLPCHHFFCQKCMETYCTMHVKEGTVMKMLCPDAKCGGLIPPALLKQLLGDDDLKRWESLLLEKTLETMSDVVYCPRCETACLEDEDHHAQCVKCFFSFCSLCRERRHVGVHCMTLEEKLLILQERQSSSQIKNAQREKEKAMINEILNVREVLRDAKQCPSCQMAISRTEGCNKMICENCGQYFCYRCSKAIDGYDHYKDGACELFSEEEIRRWEERMNPRAMVQRLQTELNPEIVHPCPNCRQHNAKIGNNNHIFCWSCQNYFCALCRKTVKKSSEHFGPKGCKQHTADS